MKPRQTDDAGTSMNLDRPVPQYQQVANLLRAQIISIRDERPVRLTAERQLCQIHQVSRETVRNALRVLEADGLIARTPGCRGTMTDPGGIRAWRRLHRARMIAIVAATGDTIVPGTFYGDSVQAAMASAESAGYSTLLLPVRRTFPRICTQLNTVDSQDLLGVILAGIHDESVVRMHAQAGHPVVVLDYLSPDRRVDAVVVDCFGEGQQAAELLLELGHRHLFYVGNTLRDASLQYYHETDADLLLAGFMRRLRNAGVDLPAERIVFCYCSPEDVRGVVRQVSSLRPRPTAGLIFSSGTLRLFRKWLPEMGLTCPQDVSLVCKAGISEDLDATSLRADPAMMGRLAVQLLLERVRGGRERAVCVAVRSTLQGNSTTRLLR